MLEDVLGYLCGISGHRERVHASLGEEVIEAQHAVAVRRGSPGRPEPNRREEPQLGIRQRRVDRHDGQRCRRQVDMRWPRDDLGGGGG